MHIFVHIYIYKYAYKLYKHHITIHTSKLALSLIYNGPYHRCGTLESQVAYLDAIAGVSLSRPGRWQLMGKQQGICLKRNISKNTPMVFYITANGRNRFFWELNTYKYIYILYFEKTH